MGRSNAEILAEGLKIAAKKRKARENQIDEIKWDDDARKYVVDLMFILESILLDSKNAKYISP